MVYATPEDYLRQVKGEVVELANPDNPDALTAVPEEIAGWLQTASDEIDQIIGGRYLLPLTAAPNYLKYACCCIARKQMDSFNLREKVIRDYDDVIWRLRAIASGKEDLLINGQPLPERGSGVVNMALDCI